MANLVNSNDTEIISSGSNIEIDLTAKHSVINNLTTASAGNGVLDAYQGKILDDKINNGWIPLTGTLTFVSWDSTTYTSVVNSNLDLTPYLSVGMKFKFTQNSAIKYAFITAITSTQLTLFLGTDYSLNNSAISNSYYSMLKAPYGFPIKYSQEIYSTNEQVVGMWIDGKPIYRKVISIGSLPNNGAVSISTDITNIAQMTDMKMIWRDTEDKAWINQNRTDSLSVMIRYYYRYSTNSIFISAVGTNWGSRTSNAYAILEYTKTTD